MAIVYTIKKIKDDQVLTVSQDTTYTLLLGLRVIESKSVISGSTTILTAHSDGDYTINLTADSEPDASGTFSVVRYLQNSIILDSLNLLCDCGCTTSISSNNCVKGNDLKVIKNKNIFTKLLTFQSVYLSKYSETMLADFTAYIEKVIAAGKCSTQAKIAQMTTEECITGNSTDTTELFKLYVIAYWSGMYFIEKAQIGSSDTEELLYLDKKFKVTLISECICGSCVTMSELEVLFGVLTPPIQIYSFQFDGVLLGVSDLETIVTDDYLENTATLEDEAVLIVGKNIEAVFVGRVGFAVKTTNQTPYQIFDTLGNDVTTITFTTEYDAVREILFYVAINSSTPSTVFYRFVKN